MARASIIAELTAIPSADGRELRAIAQAAEWLEVRADITGDLDPGWVRNFFPGKILYSLRSNSSGGMFEGSEAERASRLLNASRNYDLIELEACIDLRSDLLTEIADQRRVLSWYGQPMGDEGMVTTFRRLSSTPGKIYKMVVEGRYSEDALGPLRLMKSLGRPDLVAYASGKSGFWSRMLALQFGAPIIFGSAATSWTSEGAPPVFQLIEDYGLPSLSPVEKIYGIVGNPVIHSLSPRIHNAAYRALKRPALFLPFQTESFDKFWNKVVHSGALESLGLSIEALTVSSPYKEIALQEACAASQMSRYVGAANVLLRGGGQWKADTTDPEGVMVATGNRDFSVTGKKAAIVGCGGAGRAIAAALNSAGADVTLVNRGAERGRMAAKLLGLPYVALSSFDARNYSILVNATPVGRDDDEAPFALKGLSKDAIIIDLVYRPTITPLIANALALGLATIDGREVLLIQVCEQFRKMTGRDMPVSVAHEVLRLNKETAARTQTV
ncbi:MAG: type I 3-dehydroquinate dehydratase [Blastocatellia bacterium]